MTSKNEYENLLSIWDSNGSAEISYSLRYHPSERLFYYVAHHPRSGITTNQRVSMAEKIAFSLQQPVNGIFTDTDTKDRSTFDELVKNIPVVFNTDEYNDTTLIVSTWKDVAHPKVANVIDDLGLEVFIADEIREPLITWGATGTGRVTKKARDHIMDVNYRIRNYLKNSKSGMNKENTKNSILAQNEREQLIGTVFDIMEECGFADIKHVAEYVAYVDGVWSRPGVGDWSVTSARTKINAALRKEMKRVDFKKKAEEIKKDPDYKKKQKAAFEKIEASEAYKQHIEEVEYLRLEEQKLIDGQRSG